MGFIMKFKKSCKNKQQSKKIRKLTHIKRNNTKWSEKNEKKNHFFSTFGAWEFGVKAPTCIWQEGEWKYHTNQGNTNNNNTRRLVTTMWKEQHQELVQ
jgi:hypothetical protein